MAHFSFLQLDSIKGSCTEEGHKDWISVNEYQYSLHHTLAGDMHSQGAITGGIVKQGDLIIRKNVDAASPVLALYCCKSQNIKKAVLEICRMINGKKVPYIKYTMSDVAVTSLAPGGKAGDKGEDVPTETLTLRPSKMDWEYTPTDQEGSKAAIKHGWDFPNQKQNC
jgi:type VI secretion system secreted protein Hcp